MQPRSATPTPERDEGPLVAPARLSQEAGRALLEAARARLAAGASSVRVDLRGVERMDTQGAAFLQLAARTARERGAELKLEGARGRAAELLELVRPALEETPPSPPPSEGLLERLGGRAFAARDELRAAVALAVDLLYWAVLAPLRGKGLRWGALLDELHEMGVRALGIVALLNFLLGVIIALLSAAQLKQFGATIYVADLVVVAFARELGAFLTAIIVSARSGAAITAELATMRVREEIDALRSMGLNVARFLLVPKLWALLLAVPALTVLAMAAGNAGGSFVGISILGESPVAWWNELVAAAALGDILQGLFKSGIFAVIIALVACHNGLRVEGGARGIGLATTRSVVIDIFLIIVADMAFATFFFFV
ncbi:MAG TPA: ABC transporter permease [Planctomycetota bacterium]|nr:ABC transporter permease [Planctomycetota bacterium]HRR80030.1 ABC transporter permease [Planctomycetota bacterium]